MSVFNNNMITSLRASYLCKMSKLLAVPAEQHIKLMYILVSKFSLIVINANLLGFVGSSGVVL